MRLFLDPDVGPALIAHYLDDPLSNADYLRAVAEHFLNVTNGSQRMEWLEQQLRECLGDDNG